MTVWRIFCPGPTLESDFLNGPDLPCHSPSIVVNTAILFKFRRIYPVVCWAMNDPQVFKRCMESLPQDIIQDMKSECCIWTHCNFENAGTGQAGAWDSGTLQHWQETAKLMWDVNFWNAHGFMDAGFFRHYSMMSAIGYALHRGAKQVFIYGAPLGGSGYFQTGLENDRTRHIEKRWKEERGIYEAVKHYAELMGITIKRVGHE